MPLKIIIIHGLNNNMNSFIPLAHSLKALGYVPEILCLPGHGSNREETRHIKTATENFDRSMEKLIQGPYAVIAFSQGALYLQLWLEKNKLPLPKAQVLLAPALFIRHVMKLDMLMSKLPSFMFIPSLMPRKLRRYNSLNIWEYRTLFNKAKEFQKINTPMKIPTLILVDPRDELVDAQNMKSVLDNRQSGAQIEFYERKYLQGRRPGKYHILFHPDYFTPDDWDHFIAKISCFFSVE